MYVNFFKSLVSKRISEQENDIARYSTSIEDLDTCSCKLVLSTGCLNLPPKFQHSAKSLWNCPIFKQKLKCIKKRNFKIHRTNLGNRNGI